MDEKFQTIHQICPFAALTVNVDDIQKLLEICYLYGDNSFTFLDGFIPCWVMAHYLK